MPRDVDEFNELLERLGSDHRVRAGDLIGPDLVLVLVILLERIEKLEAKISRNR